MNNLSHTYENLPYEYLIELFLETGYPKIVDLCQSNTYYKKICDDNYFWELLLKQDYYNVVTDNKFSDPKEVYLTIHKAFNTKNSKTFVNKIYNLISLSIQTNNLELFKFLNLTQSKHIDSPSFNVNLLSIAIIHLAIDTIKYLLSDKNKNYIVDENDISYFYRNLRSKLDGDALFVIMLQDDHFNVYILIENAIKFNYLDDLKLLLNFTNDVEKVIKFALDKSINNNNKKIMNFLINEYNISEQTIENIIVKLDKKLKYDQLDLLLDTKKYNTERLLLKLTKHSGFTYSISYLLRNNNFKQEVLNKIAMYLVTISNNDKILDLLLELTNFNPRYSNDLLIRKSNSTFFIETIINDQNYQEILINIINDFNLKDEFFKMIINIPFFSKTTRRDGLQKILFELLNLSFINENNVLLLIEKVKVLGNKILNKCLKISVEKNLLLVINRLKDYEFNNVDFLFNIALSNKNFMAAAMISNYNLCDYLDQINYFESCFTALTYINEGFLYVVEKSLSSLINDEKEKIKFVKKYDTYLDLSNLNLMIEEIYNNDEFDI